MFFQKAKMKTKTKMKKRRSNFFLQEHFILCGASHHLEPFCEIKSKTCHLKEPFLNLPFIRYEL
jgi:hypothetical protein